ncbi:MAG: C10 family peptidase [Muribaculaceae bacterium]
MKRFIITIASFLLAIMVLFANEITAEQARNIAWQFVNATANVPMRARAANPQQLVSAELNYDRLHGFNLAGGGFVVVSGDSRTYPILCYSDHGSLDLNDLPTNALAWLESYNYAIKTLAEEAAGESSDAIITGEVIAPLLATTWYQDGPYNDLCPVLTVDGEDEKAPTGCVATAMAQVMYFYQWPKEACTEIPAYTFNYDTSTHGNTGEDNTAPMEMPALPPTTFDWDNMLLSYKDVDATDAQKQAVAVLMQYCGQALRMTYNLWGSDATETALTTALRNYFGYDANVASAKREYYGIEEWETLIYNELLAGRPVPYAANNNVAGHSFVCDGFDGNGLFHINWGWGGKADGYFRLSVLNPMEVESIGSNSSPYGYNMMQEAVVGVQPPVESTAPVEDDHYFTLYTPMTVGNGQVVMNIMYESLSEPDGNVVMGLATVGEDEAINTLFISEAAGMTKGTPTEFRVAVDPAQLPQGDTRLYPVARMADADDAHWHFVANRSKHILATLTPETLTLRVLPEIKLNVVEACFENADQQCGDEGNILITLETLADEFSDAVDIYLLPIGTNSAEDIDIRQYLIMPAFQTGVFLRPGHPEVISFTYTPIIPGNLLAVVCSKNSREILAYRTATVGGDVPYWDFQVEEYSFDFMEGSIIGSMKVRNCDKRPWMFFDGLSFIIIYVDGVEHVCRGLNTYGVGESQIMFFDFNIYDEDEGDVPQESYTIHATQVLGNSYTRDFWSMEVQPGGEYNDVENIAIAPNESSSKWFNLQGIEISEPTQPGIYINNGKKIIIR